MTSSGVVHVIDDDIQVREALCDLLESVDYNAVSYKSASDFLENMLPDEPACIVLDVRLPGTSGLELQEYLKTINVGIPVILMTAFGDIHMSVRGMKSGAVDFLTKPIRDQELLDAVTVAVKKDRARREGASQLAKLQKKYELLTGREREVMLFVASGLMNKQIASELSISEVTVKMHRGNVMRKLEAKTAAMLARIAQQLNLEM
jgi:FixJ family two-component response regulator